MYVQVLGWTERSSQSCPQPASLNLLLSSGANRMVRGYLCLALCSSWTTTPIWGALIGRSQLQLQNEMQKILQIYILFSAWRGDHKRLYFIKRLLWGRTFQLNRLKLASELIGHYCSRKRAGCSGGVVHSHSPTLSYHHPQEWSLQEGKAQASTLHQVLWPKQTQCVHLVVLSPVSGVAVSHGRAEHRLFHVVASYRSQLLGNHPWNPIVPRTKISSHHWLAHREKPRPYMLVMLCLLHSLASANTFPRVWLQQIPTGTQASSHE